MQELTTLSTEHSEYSTVIADFPPVDAQDFADWLAELGVRNPNYAGQVIDALAQTLKPHERQMFNTDNRLHMKDIEIVQRMIYEKAVQQPANG